MQNYFRESSFFLSPTRILERHYDSASAEVTRSVDIAAGTTIAGTTIGIINTSPTFPGSLGVTGQASGSGFWQIGRTIEVVLRGIATTGATPGTMLFEIREDTTGGTSIAASATVTLLASQTNVTWEFRADIVCQSLGTAGKIWTQGHWMCNEALFAPNLIFVPASAPAQVTLDTTANHSFVVCTTFSQAGTSMTTEQAFWRVRN